jgi:GAF domain-containing protein
MSPSREEKLAEVLAEFARTLGTDFSIQAILDRLVRRVVHVLPVTAAGVLLGNADGLGFVAASNATILEIEAAQREYAEGPCLECLATGVAVGVPDLTTDTRFPRFSARTAQSGMAAVFTFPLRGNGQLLGALDLYRDVPGDLDPDDARAAGTLADVAGAYLYNAHVRAEAATRLDALRHSTLHDALTGLANRTLFAELLERAVGKARRSRGDVAVLFVTLTGSSPSTTDSATTSVTCC